MKNASKKSNVKNVFKTANSITHLQSPQFKRTVEQRHRGEALLRAMECRMSSHTTDQVIASAQQFFDFLQGNVAKAPAVVADKSAETAA